MKSKEKIISHLKEINSMHDYKMLTFTHLGAF